MDVVRYVGATFPHTHQGVFDHILGFEAIERDAQRYPIKLVFKGKQVVLEIYFFHASISKTDKGGEKLHLTSFFSPQKYFTTVYQRFATSLFYFLGHEYRFFSIGQGTGEEIEVAAFAPFEAFAQFGHGGGKVAHG